MATVKVIIDMINGDVRVSASVPDASIINLILDKAKLKLLNGVKLQEQSSILTPTNGVN